MKTTILFLLLSVSAFAQDYRITRYEVKSDALFVCINSTTKPVYVEHFLTADERKDDKAITATIERLVAELQIKEDKYVEPEKFVSNMVKAAAVKVDPAKIAVIKADIIKVEIAKADSIAKIPK